MYLKDKRQKKEDKFFFVFVFFIYKLHEEAIALTVHLSEKMIFALT
jgi:hypothetical protein